MDLKGIRSSGQTSKDTRPYKILEFDGGTITPKFEEPDVGVVVVGNPLDTNTLASLGIDPNGNVDASSILATTDASAPSYLIIANGQTMYLAQSLTLINTTLVIHRGGRVKVANGKYLNTCGIVAGNYQIVDMSLGGRVNPIGQSRNIHWWGALPDLNTDQSQAFTWAMDACGRGAVIEGFLPGVYKFNNWLIGGRRSPLTADTASGNLLHLDPLAVMPPGWPLLPGDKIAVDLLDYPNSQAMTVQSSTSTTVTTVENVSVARTTGEIVSGPGQLIQYKWIPGMEFKPFANDRLITISQPGNSTSDWMRWFGGKISSDFNHDYTNPIVFVSRQRNLQLDSLLSNITGTGVLFHLDGSYLGACSNNSLQMGHYAVAFESDQSFQQQIDTLAEGPNFIYGNFGGILRRSVTGADIHGFRLPHFKVALPAGVDFQTKVETHLKVAVAPGASSLTLWTGEGASWVAGDAVWYGVGSTIETNKVLTVVGDVLNLVKPVQYAQTGDAADTSIATPVMGHGFGYSVCTNVFNLDISNYHWEGVGVGLVVEGSLGLHMHDGYNGANENIRIHGATQDALIEMIAMAGPSGLGNQYIGRYHPFRASTSAARIHVGRGCYKTPSAATIATDGTTGYPIVGLSSSRTQSAFDAVSGIPRESRNVDSGSLAAVMLRATAAGVDRWIIEYGGTQYWVETATNLYRPDTRKLAMDSLLIANQSIQIKICAGATPVDGTDWPELSGGPPNGTIAFNNAGALYGKFGGTWAAV